MLSAIDIRKQMLEGGILVYPLVVRSAKGDTISGDKLQLHVSEFAWSVRTRAPLDVFERSGEKYMEIAAGDSALIYSSEVLSLSPAIAGTLHSVVPFVSRGLGHIGTSIDANYHGPLVITVHNHSDKPVAVNVGERFAKIAFHYLETPCSGVLNDSGKMEVIENFSGTEKFRQWIHENPWTENPGELKNRIEISGAYGEIKALHERDRKRQLRQRLGSAAVTAGRFAAAWAAILLLLVLFGRVFEWGTFSVWCADLLKTQYVPLMLTSLVTLAVFKAGERK